MPLKTGKIELINNMINTGKTRIEYFDILKGIGILYMVLGHCSAGGDAMNHYIHAFHMPLFFFVSGYFFNAKKYPAFKDFLWNELRTIMLPYTVFVLLCQPLHYLYTGEFDFKYFILSYFTSNHNRIDVSGAYWFLLCFFVVRILYFGIEKACRKEWQKIGILLGMTVIGNCSGIGLPLCLDSAFSVIALMYLGKKVKEHQDSSIVQKALNMNLWLVLFLLGVNAGMIMLSGRVNIRTNYYEHILLYWVNCLLAILCYTNLARIIEKSSAALLAPVGRVLQYIGANSMVYLTTNEIVIYAVTVVLSFVFSIFKIGDSILLNGWMRYVIAAMTMAAITVIAMVVERTWIKVIFGKR